MDGIEGSTLICNISYLSFISRVITNNHCELDPGATYKVMWALSNLFCKRRDISPAWPRISLFGGLASAYVLGVCLEPRGFGCCKSRVFVERCWRSMPKDMSWAQQCSHSVDCVGGITLVFCTLRKDMLVFVQGSGR